MSTPARCGVVIYSADIQKLSEFYIGFFQMTKLRETPEFVSLDKDGFNIIIHSPPIEIPENNFHTVKVFMTVASLAAAKESVVEFGGTTMAGEWGNPIFKICNIADPDGNHIQIREFFK
jgi:predicted enzyme related to lactoylglutathione lyase